jgi:hypothetical protein
MADLVDVTSVEVMRSVAGSRGAVVVTLTFAEPTDDARVEYVAAAPPHKNASFSGSCLPYTTVDQAFYGTPNRGQASVRMNRSATIQLVGMPGSFYTGLGTVVVPPTLYVAYHSGGQRRTAAVVLHHGVPFRTLTYPDKRKSAAGAFYDVKFPLARSQEQILYEAAYPADAGLVADAEPRNFWGGKPPL